MIGQNVSRVSMMRRAQIARSWPIACISSVPSRKQPGDLSLLVQQVRKSEMFFQNGQHTCTVRGYKIQLQSSGARGQFRHALQKEPFHGKSLVDVKLCVSKMRRHTSTITSHARHTCLNAEMEKMGFRFRLKEEFNWILGKMHVYPRRPVLNSATAGRTSNEKTCRNSYPFTLGTRSESS